MIIIIMIAETRINHPNIHDDDDDDTRHKIYELPHLVVLAT